MNIIASDSLTVFHKQRLAEWVQVTYLSQNPFVILRPLINDF